MKKPVVNLEELEYQSFGKGEKFRAERAPVAPLIGARNLGYSVIRLEPGKRAWPRHAHHVIEEMFYILSGEGTLRHGGEEFPIRAGDFIAAPPDPSLPHQIVNTSGDVLTYMALSDRKVADVILYPDSGKFGVWHGDWRNPDAPDNFLYFGRRQLGLGYWDGEDTGDAD